MQSQLAELFVQITAKGSDSVTKAVTGLRKTLDVAGASAGRMAAGVKALTTGMAAGFTAPIGAAAGFANSVAGGSVEAERLADSLTLLKRVLVDELAPYVRNLTSLVGAMAVGWSQVDPALKRTIAGVLAAGAAFASLVVVIPAITAAAGAFMAVIGAIASPVGMAIAAIVGLVAVAGGGFASITGAANGSTLGWVGTLIDGIKVVTTGFADLFNWIAKGWAKVADGFAIGVGVISEAVGLVPKGTVEAMVKASEAAKNSQGDLFDTAKIDAAFDKFKNGVVGMKGGLGEAWEAAKGLARTLGGDDGKGGFKYRFKASLEGGQQTFDRLLTEFAGMSDGPDGLLKQQIEIAKGQDQKLGQLVDGIQKVADAMPAVR